MKTILTTIFLSFFCIYLTQAQEIKYPLQAKVKNEATPSNLDNSETWVKGHWEFKQGKYSWIEGTTVPIKSGHVWVDGEWERNNKSGWWVFNSGYWQKKTDEFQVKSNDLNIKENTTSNLALNKKSSGFFINTGEK